MAYEDGVVSIVVPVYNAESFLIETLDSLAAQTYKDIEVLLVDDGSKDSSRAICEQYSECDKRFRYVYQENAGAAAARNHGIDLARGEFLVFLDADDLFEPELVEKLHDAITLSGADVATCRADSFNVVYEPAKACLLHEDALIEGGVYKPADIAEKFFQVMTTCPWDKMFRARHIAKEGLRYQNLRYSNDTYFVLMALLTAPHIAVIEDVLVHYRFGLGGSLRDKMYLSPYCDLDMLAALREGVSKTDMANNEEILGSLDLFTVDIIIYSGLNLASQSEVACANFLSHLRGSDVPKPRSLLSFPFSYETAKRVYKYLALFSIPAEGLAWAVTPPSLGVNGWRGAEKSQVHAVYLRFLLAPAVAVWGRIKRLVLRNEIARKRKVRHPR